MLHNKIKIERKNICLTQYQKADMLKVSLRTYQRIESNQTKPSCGAIKNYKNFSTNLLTVCWNRQLIDKNIIVIKSITEKYPKVNYFY
ncbi:helix-turn-helix transcriptional regulator [Sedimentibacter sp. zth1]|uniref:helix-turn-helix transcriptional regulator n=1 Tax=Sedimentibacter sp. zth1 TaxID=2816908 RepID=UPI001A90F650|nr:helix-turn-helix domain-containing protein [Sedimentibacter sp. zth1]QSX05444.1 helix-turn-helix transcriptional regulator [Sedimentibacter sp. zth1]